VKFPYGLDFPPLVRDLAMRAGLFLAAGIGLWISNGANAVAWISLLIGTGFGVMVAVDIWSSLTGKLQMRDRLLDSIVWKGDEKVLDIGCGSGLLLIGAAKRLQTGKATGVDLWSKHDLSGNTADAARDNATKEGVLPRIKIDTADAQKLPYSDASFDVVVSANTLYALVDPAKGLAEIARVLKPGGQLRIFDISDTAEYAKQLQALGISDVVVSGPSWLWCKPSRTVSGRKQS
jgi:SAM-dependent methyltransferase